MKLAPGGREAVAFPFIIGIVLAGGAFASHYAIGDAMSTRGADILLVVLMGPAVAFAVWSLFLIWFFRDPERTAGLGVVSPADGKVLFVEPFHDPDVGHGHRIAVFMSPLNVHVNRAPVSGTLVTLTHFAGAYLPAFNKESERNERVVTLWHADGRDEGGARAGDVLKVVQIAGAVAKRIVPWAAAGDQLQRGERFGMIRLGSRVDVYLPAGLVPAVASGETVRAATTTLARRSPP